MPRILTALTGVDRDIPSTLTALAGVERVAMRDVERVLDLLEGVAYNMLGEFSGVAKLT